MRSKYGNKKVVVDGYSFDSKLEARRFGELKLFLKQGIITSLVLQKEFELQPSFKCNGKTERAIKYVCDFYYKDKHGNEIVEDTKSVATKTQVYMVKRKLFLYKYPHIKFFEIIK